LSLAAGKIHGDEAWLCGHFSEQGWDLWTPTAIRADLTALRDSKYENSVASVVPKLILRGEAEEDDDADGES